MPLIWYVVVFSLLGSVGSVVLSALLLVFKKEIQKKVLPHLLSYATGALLAAAFIGLIPEAIEHVGHHEEHSIFLTIIIGIIVFFILEKLILWHHCHNKECEGHKAAAPMILVGDALHNLIDGIVIVASFLISVPVGIAVSLSVILHEVPQEVGDFAILLHAGYSRKKAFILNTLVSLTTVASAVIAYFMLDVIESIIPYVMALSAASFLYIALADLSPELHKKVGFKNAIVQIFFIGLGIVTITLVLSGHNH